MKKYFVYKAINIINNKCYIGKHETSNENDGYMGSGVALNAAIRKYGKANFNREILEYASSSEELNMLESKYITEDFLNSSNSYNCAPGGQGGNTIKHWSISAKQQVYKKISNALRGRKTGPRNYPSPLSGRPLSEEHKIKISRGLKGKSKPTRSTEHAKNISNSLKGRHLSNTAKSAISATMKTNHANSKAHTCPHCGKIGKSGSMKRWHFDNCNQK
jgi:hypothetical protein